MATRAREHPLNNPASFSGIASRTVDRLYQWPAVLLTLTAVFWAGNAIVSRLAVDNISPFLLVFLRWVLVLAVMWPMYGGQVRAHWGEIRPRLLRITLMAIFGFTGFNALFYTAGYYTSVINIGILQGSIPVVVLAGAYFMYGTRTTLVQIAGVLITSVGVIVVATQGAPLSILEIGFNRGDVAMLAACVLYAFYTLELRERPNMPGIVFFTLLALISAITSVPLLVAEAMMYGLALPTLQGWLVTLFVAVFPSCLAQLF